MKNKAGMSRKSDEWETPQWLFDIFNATYNFTFDAAATRENSKCGPSYGDEIGDALTLDWHRHSRGGNIWLNPPYSMLREFMKKAYETSLTGVTVVCLIPARTDTRAWHDYVMRAKHIIFVKGRLKFVNRALLPSYTETGSFKLSPAPYPSCVVIFEPPTGTDRRPEFSTMRNVP